MGTGGHDSRQRAIGVLQICSTGRTIPPLTPMVSGAHQGAPLVTPGQARARYASAHALVAQRIEQRTSKPLHVAYPMAAYLRLYAD
jgi:hypothetical protein